MKTYFLKKKNIEANPDLKNNLFFNPYSEVAILQFVSFILYPSLLTLIIF